MRKDIHQEILLDLINQGYDRKGIGEHFNLSKNSVGYHLHKHRLNITKLKYNQKQQQSIRLYNDGYSTTEIKKHLGYDPWHFLKFKGLIRNQSEAQLAHYKKSPKPKYTKLDIPADIMQNPEFGYWLGLVFSDGCITRDGVYIALQKRDKELVYLFKKIGEKLFNKKGHLININRSEINGFFHHKKVYKRKPQIKCMFYSVALSRYLKSFRSLDFLKNTNLVFNRNFLSGFFDGEGHVSPNDIKLAQKNDTIFFKISNLLHILGIKHHTYKIDYGNPINLMSIGTYKYRTIFANIINFKLKRKQGKLIETLSWRIKNVI